MYPSRRPFGLDLMMQILRRTHTERFGINSHGAGGKDEPRSTKPIDYNMIKTLGIRQTRTVSGLRRAMRDR
jgi:hypothetical protein